MLATSFHSVLDHDVISKKGTSMKKTILFRALLFTIILYATFLKAEDKMKSPSGSSESIATEEDIMKNDVFNLKLIGLSLMIWKSEHSHIYPNDLGVLLDGKILVEGKYFITLGSHTVIPKNGDDIRKGQCDYVYIGKDIRDNSVPDPDKPVAFTKIQENSKYFCVLYADSHVANYSLINLPEQIKALIKANSKEVDNSKNKDL